MGRFSRIQIQPRGRIHDKADQGGSLLTLSPRATAPDLGRVGLHFAVRKDPFADCLWEGLFKLALRPASEAVCPDPSPRFLTTSPSTQPRLPFLPQPAAHSLKSPHHGRPSPPPAAPFTYSIPIGPRLTGTRRIGNAPTNFSVDPSPCPWSTADTALMCYQQLSVGLGDQRRVISSLVRL
jgi:hypothetical protein